MHFYGRQVCLNGHVITSYLGASWGDARAQTFCDRCGERTINTCPQCKVEMRGFAFGSTFPDKAGAKPYCFNCGRPYPWTERHLAAAAELVEENEILDEAEKKTLTATFAEITSENPRTTLAATRFKRLASKAGKGVGEALQKMLVDVASEAAKKIILGE